MSQKEKIRLFKKIGVEKLILIDADKKFLSYSPAEFLHLLKTNFQIDEFVVGHDFAFGKNRKGDLKRSKLMALASTKSNRFYSRKKSSPRL